MKKRVLPFSVLLLLAVGAHAQFISTIAGTGFFGFSGDGGPASMAQLYDPTGVAVGPHGAVYIADAANNRIRRIDTMGIITTFAGNGVVVDSSAGSYSGDGGPANAAGLALPMAVTVDGNGNVYIADGGNSCIRMVNTAGIIRTVAGNHIPGFSGDGGPATAAQLNFPTGITVDRYGNMYIADFSNDRIRKVDTAGIITTVAGNGYAAAIDSGGYSGDGGPADSAALYYPNAATLDDSMNLFIADSYNNRIRKVTPAGIITTVAGNGSPGYNGDGIPADSANLCAPSAVAFDAHSNMYIVDECTSRIRQVSPTGIISTFAGNGTLGYMGDGDLASLAELGAPADMVLDNKGNYYIADYNNQCIRFITSLTTGIHPLPTEQSITVFPNPSDGIFTLGLPITGTGSIVMVYDIYGRAITTLEAVAGTGKMQINLDNLPPATYLLKVQTGDNCVTKEIVIR